MDQWEVFLEDYLGDLISSAQSSLANAYAPYSNFPVGAAVLSANGTIFSGCNVENASFGLTTCAERVALFSAVAAGHVDDIVAVAVVSRTNDVCRPCGACRQVVAEFSRADSPILIVSIGSAGNYVIEPISALLPHQFTLL